MSLPDGFKRVFRSPRPAVHQDVDDEVAFHLAETTRELIRAGMTPDEADREARRRFGDVQDIGGQARTIQSRMTRRRVRFERLDSWWRDVRYAARTLRRNPGFAVVAVATIALGIGPTTAIFSVVDGVLLKPLPFPDSDRLVRVVQQNSPTNRFGLSVVDFQAVQEHQQTLTGVAGLVLGSATVTGIGEPEVVRTGAVTAEWFRTFGVEPTVGRGFRTGEDVPGVGRVAVVSHAAAVRWFGSAETAVGQALQLDGHQHVVVGVLASDLSWPWSVDVWPVFQPEAPTRRGPFIVTGVARMRAGGSLEHVTRDLDRVSTQIYPVWADGFTDQDARITPFPLKDTVVGDVGFGLTLLFGAVVLVLLIAVANVANLMLARASARRREIALRSSLGAGRGRLIRQLLIESTVVAALGGGVGIILAYLGLDILVALGPNVPRIDQIQVDGRTLGFAATVTLCSGLLFGLAPLVHLRAANSAAALRDGRGTVGGGKMARRVRSALVTAEFALALPLLVGAALMVTSLARLQQVDAGFDPDDLLLASVSPPSGPYPTRADLARFWTEALADLAAVPGVGNVAVTSGLPPNDPGWFNNFDLLDKPVPAGTPEPVVPWVAVSPSYFATLQVRLLKGRLLDASDIQGAPGVLVVSRRWAERFFGEEEVLGKQVYEGGDRSYAWTVVGVVDDVKYRGLGGQDPGAVYASYSQNTWRGVHLVVRTVGGLGIGPIQERLRAREAGLALSNIETMHDKMAGSVAQPRYWAILVGTFAVVGLLLAAVGVYGVLSYSVGRQRRDIGVRMALGATASSVRMMVVRRGMKQAVAGLGIGLIIVIASMQAIDQLLFDVSPRDPGVLFVMSSFLLLVALAACYGPARRATRVNPAQVISEE